MRPCITGTESAGRIPEQIAILDSNAAGWEICSTAVERIAKGACGGSSRYQQLRHRTSRVGTAADAVSKHCERTGNPSKSLTNRPARRSIAFRTHWDAVLVNDSLRVSSIR